MEIEKSIFDGLPTCLRAWMATRAFRRGLPFLDQAFRILDRPNSDGPTRLRQIILVTELFAFDSRVADELTWFRSYRTRLEKETTHYDRDTLFSCLAESLRRLKPFYSSGPLGSGTCNGDYFVALEHFKDVVGSFEAVCVIPTGASKRLKEDWLLHLYSDAQHFTEIAESLQGDSDISRRLSLEELGLVFCFLPDCFEEQVERDTEYQRPLYATDSFMLECINEM